MAHKYWVAMCKTKGCGNILRANYIGDVAFATHGLPAGSDRWWDVRCDRCGKDHRYTVSDLVPIDLIESPQPEFVPWFSSPIEL
jgi:hypothetical protein